MYDTRQEANEFVGDNLKEATAKAAEFFGTEAAELKISKAPEGEIFGTGGRTVIVAAPKNIAARSSRPREESRDREDRGPRREERGGRNDRGDRGGRGDSRGRGGPRGRGNDHGDRGEKEDRGDRNDRGGDRGGRSERGGRGGRGDSRGETRERLEPVAPVAVEKSKGSIKGTVGPIGDFLKGTLELMKLGDFEISESSEGDFLIYQLSGPAAEVLQQGDGRATDALQLVANQVSMRQSDDAPRIVVDVEGGGDEREETLSRLADRAVKRAKDTGRSIALDPMNSRDRRAIHIAIREVDDVATMSIGEGRYRQVLVVPEGAPEYDDAVSESSD
jgi:predicted RNA-binding protein Jag